MSMITVMAGLSKRSHSYIMLAVIDDKGVGECGTVLVLGYPDLS